MYLKNMIYQELSSFESSGELGKRNNVEVLENLYPLMRMTVLQSEGGRSVTKSRVMSDHESAEAEAVLLGVGPQSFSGYR